MKQFFDEHPAKAEICDTVLAILSGSFAFIAVGAEWLSGFIADRRRK